MPGPKITAKQAAASFLLALAAPAAAQLPPGPPTLVAHSLKGGAYYVQGDAANTGFVIGTDGVVVIDVQRSPEAGRDQIAQIAKVTGKPVKAVILTHGDPDHLGGLPAYPAGTEIIAHENIRAQIIAAANDSPTASPFVPLYKQIVATRMPTRTTAGTESMVLGGVPVTLIHVAPAHSGGDIAVFLPKQRVVFGGDILTMDIATYPIIHVGGSSEGWIQSVQAMLALPADTYVSGHGGLKTKAQLQAQLNQVVSRREAIKAMVYQGKSLAEVQAALPEKAASPMFLNFNETTYYELSRGYPVSRPSWYSLAPTDDRRKSEPVH